MTSSNNQRRETHRSAEALCDTELDAVIGGSMTELVTLMTNLANMRHEMLKAVAQNLRG